MEIDINFDEIRKHFYNRLYRNITTKTFKNPRNVERLNLLLKTQFQLENDLLNRPHSKPLVITTYDCDVYRGNFKQLYYKGDKVFIEFVLYDDTDKIRLEQTLDTYKIRCIEVRDEDIGWIKITDKGNMMMNK